MYASDAGGVSEGGVEIVLIFLLLLLRQLALALQETQKKVHQFFLANNIFFR